MCCVCGGGETLGFLIFNFLGALNDLSKLKNYFKNSYSTASAYSGRRWNNVSF